MEDLLKAGRLPCNGCISKDGVTQRKRKDAAAYYPAVMQGQNVDGKCALCHRKDERRAKMILASVEQRQKRLDDQRRRLTEAVESCEESSKDIQYLHRRMHSGGLKKPTVMTMETILADLRLVLVRYGLDQEEIDEIKEHFNENYADVHIVKI
jgi:hypothetical protein